MSERRALVAGSAPEGDRLVKSHEDENIRKQRCLVIIRGRDDPALAVAGDLDVLDVRKVHAFDVQMLFYGGADTRGTAGIAALELTFDLLERPGDLHVVEVHGRDPDTRVTADSDRD